MWSHITEAAFAHIDLTVSGQNNFQHLTLMSKYFFNIVDMKQAFLAKRKKFEMNTKATIKTTNEKLDCVWKTHQEQI